MAIKKGNRLTPLPKPGRVVPSPRKFTGVGKGSRIRGRLRRGRS